MMLGSTGTFLVILTLVSSPLYQCLDNGLARTPPMGWMSWERYRCVIDCTTYPNSCVNEALYMEMADRLAADGWKELGYISVHLDDCWMARNRTTDGKLQGDKGRFPHGMKALGDYIHSKGLQYGIYEDFGTKTCAGYPGSLGHLKTDADTFAEWGVDYLKLDGCNSNVTQMNTGYPEMERYLNATGRPIVFSCSWPDYLLAHGIQPDYKAVAASCNLWRNSYDVDDNWSNVQQIIAYYTKNYDTLAPVHGPGQWNDPDMLVVGDFGLSFEQQKSQMAIWAIFAAPLIMSNNLREMPDYARKILMNKKVIAVNQDKMGRMGRMVKQVSGINIYTKAILPPASYAVVFHYPGGAYPVKISVALQDIGLGDARGYDVVDVFTSASHGHFAPRDHFNCTVNPTGVVMITAAISAPAHSIPHPQPVSSDNQLMPQILRGNTPNRVARQTFLTSLRRQLTADEANEINNLPYL